MTSHTVPFDASTASGRRLSLVERIRYLDNEEFGCDAILPELAMWSPHSCSYLAPSLNGCGWGVFTRRPFRKGDIVEVAPMFLRLALEDDRAKVLKESVLNNYHYEYWSWDGVLGKESQYDLISFGMTMYYNHDDPGQGDDSGPNIEQRKIGREPDLEDPERSVAIVYYALRDIKPCEELLVDYGSGWFAERGMTSICRTSVLHASMESESQELKQLHSSMKASATKIVFGYNCEAFRRVIATQKEDDHEELLSYRLETAFSMLPATKAFFGDVTTSQEFVKGETVELVPLLLLPKSLIEWTILESLAFSWDDMDEASPALIKLNQSPSVFVQYQPDVETTSPETRMIPTQIEDSVLLVLAGGISMMARCERVKGCEAFNTTLFVEEDPCNRHGYCIRATATRQIACGERIVVGVKSRISPDAVYTELCLTGQPFCAAGDEEL